MSDSIDLIALFRSFVFFLYRWLDGLNSDRYILPNVDSSTSQKYNGLKMYFIALTDWGSLKIMNKWNHLSMDRPRNLNISDVS